MESQANSTMQGIKSMELEATVIRADGTVEKLGLVSAFYEDEERQAAADAAGIGRIRTCE